jgi:hypothetical protein
MAYNYDDVFKVFSNNHVKITIGQQDAKKQG